MISNKLQAAKESTRAAAERQWNGNASKDLRDEFGHDFERFLSYMAANDAGRVHVLKRSVES